MNKNPNRLSKFYRSIFIGLSLVCFSGSTSYSMESVDQSAPAPFSSRSFEIGVVGGWPVIAGITLGYWGNSIPLVVRVSSGFGTQVDLGVGIPVLGGTKKLFLGVSGGVFGYAISSSSLNFLLLSLGPTVGIHTDGFFAMAGPSMHWAGNARQLAVQVQVGYSFIL